MLMFPFEAESISYAVCKYFKIETGENSFGYIASWSQGKELKELRASLETINKTSGTLISDIERHYKEICKERGIDPNAKAEPETAPIEQPADAAKVSDRQPTGNLTSMQQSVWSFQTSENTTITCLWRKRSAFIRRFQQSE